MPLHPVIDIVPLLGVALTARAALLEPKHETALRLFNGFSEGCSDLVADLRANSCSSRLYRASREGLIASADHQDCTRVSVQSVTMCTSCFVEAPPFHELV